MRPADREAAIRRQRELAALAIRNQRRANITLAVSTAAGLVAYSAGFPLGRMLVRHQPFDVATMGLCAAAYAAVTALTWGGFLAWERWRRP